MLLFSPALQNPNEALLENAALWLQGDTIAYVGPREQIPEEAKSDPERLEIRDTLLLPGLVNAHAHLELSHLKDLSYPGDFVAWIKAVLMAKNDPNSRLPKDPFSQGVTQSLWGGATTLGDHVSVTSPLADLLRSPFRGKAFLEILGVVPEVAQDLFQAALGLKEQCASLSPHWEILPSPHSVHALDPQVLEATLALHQNLFSIHLAESEAEATYFREKTGAMHALIASRGTELKRDAKSAILELESLGRLDDRILAIHANCLDDHEIQLLAKRQVSIVHCPLSHRYFSHRPFRMKDCLDAGVTMALGTDSLASGHSLSMLDILRAAQQAFPFLKKEKIFALATLGGAFALKMENQIGILSAGKKADIIGIPWQKGNDPHQKIFEAEKVSFSMIGGRTLIG